MGTTSKTRVPQAKIAVLGLITIAVYGSWTYSFGVLLDPIVADTGWSEVGVVAAFSISAGIAGIGSMVGGWVLDRWGSRAVFFAAATIGTGSFLAAARVDTYLGFAALSAIGGGVFGSLGFYHVTQTVAARIGGPASARAITTLTVWGAFAGVIYLPLTARLTELLGWRPTLAIVTGSAGALLAVGASVVSTTPNPGDRVKFRVGMGEIVRVPGARSFMSAVALAGVSISVLVVYQVPLMTSAGLSLAMASFIAGARSLAQLLGRLPLAPIVEHLGSNRAIQLSFGAIAAGCLIVIVAGTPLVGAAFAVVAGFGIGSMSPLIGINSVEIFPELRLGVGRGTVAAAGSAAGAVGPLLGSAAVTITGSRSSAALVAAIAGLAAVMAVRTARDQRRTRAD